MSIKLGQQHCNSCRVQLGYHTYFSGRYIIAVLLLVLESTCPPWGGHFTKGNYHKAPQISGFPLSSGTRGVTDLTALMAWPMSQDEEQRDG